MDEKVSTKHKPTDQQEYIFERSTTASSNMMLDARAGCGKSSTLDMLGWKLPSKSKILYLVFNRRNADEALDKQKLYDPNDRKKTYRPPIIRPDEVIKTFNGFGLRVWSDTVKPTAVATMNSKCGDILRQIVKEEKSSWKRNEYWKVYWDVYAAIGMAKSLGYVPDGMFEGYVNRLCTAEQLEEALEDPLGELGFNLLDEVLLRSIKSAYAGNVDFNDQIYMPACFGGKFKDTYDEVFVDEYQDQNPVNHEMVRQILAKGGRLTGVGDDAQSIYAFRGAKPNGMEEAVAEYNMHRCDLSISFRCPRAIVENAQWRVPNFRWIKEGGHVEHLAELDARNFIEGSTILCRNNAPLFRLAMQLIGSGRSVSVAGSDIGSRLVGIMRKLGSEDLPRYKVMGAIADWRTAKLEQESKTAGDIADCMVVFAERGDSLGQAIGYAEWLFKQQGSIQLMTGHKSKGLEFDTVYMLDSFLLREDQQDLNLRYVMQTRSANTLYEVETPNIKF